MFLENLNLGNVSELITSAINNRFGTGRIRFVPFISYTTVGSDPYPEVFAKAWIDYCIDHNFVDPASDYIVIGAGRPNTNTAIIGIYNFSKAHCFFAMIGANYLALFGYSNGTWYYRNL